MLVDMLPKEVIAFLEKKLKQKTNNAINTNNRQSGIVCTKDNMKSVSLLKLPAPMIPTPLQVNSCFVQWSSPSSQ